MRLLNSSSNKTLNEIIDIANRSVQIVDDGVSAGNKDMGPLPTLIPYNYNPDNPNFENTTTT